MNKKIFLLICLTIQLLTLYSQVPHVEVDGNLYINGGLRLETENNASNTINLTESDFLVEISSPANVTVNLPFAADNPGQVYFLVRASPTSSSVVTIKTTGSDLMDGILTQLVLLEQYEKIKLISNGTSIWYIF